MTIRSILLYYGGSKEEHAAMKVALQLGEQHGAQVTCLYGATDLSPQLASFGDMVALPEDYIENWRRNQNRHAEAAENLFVKYAAAHPKVRHHFTYVEGNPGDNIALQGKCTDLLVIGKDEDGFDTNNHLAFFSSLFDTARPLLFVPPSATHVHCDTISIAWDGSKESARALQHSFPFLQQAKNVHILIVKSEGKRALEYKDALIAYLQLHNIKADIRVLEKNKRSTSETLLTEAENLGSTLFVMGGYSHSRLREAILGGVTRFMLQRAKMPVLMAH